MRLLQPIVQIWANEKKLTEFLETAPRSDTTRGDTGPRSHCRSSQFHRDRFDARASYQDCLSISCQVSSNICTYRVQRPNYTRGSSSRRVYFKAKSICIHAQNAGNVTGQSVDQSDEEQKTTIQQQLELPFRFLRALPRPDPDTPLAPAQPPVCIDLQRCNRLSSAIICKEHEFNRFPVTKLGISDPSLSDMYFSFMRGDHDMKMTHSDLHPRNIMVSYNAETSRKIKVEVLSN